jgi:hypothetical protein
MPRYSAVPTDDPDPTSLKTYTRKVAKWVYVFDLLRAGIMLGLTGLNIDATIISKLRIGGEGNESVVARLGIAMVGKAGLNRMQKVELGVTIFYVSHITESWSIWPSNCYRTGVADGFDMFSFDHSQAANLVLAIAVAAMRKDSPLRRTLRFTFHTLMLLAWAVYSYRDLYPLITYSKHPLDPEFLPQPIVWTRFSLLTIVAVVIPLVQPSQYRPVDPMHPSEEPNPEQTASLLSYVFYLFMDKIILQAWRSNAIPYEELPPLPDYDRASWLAKNSLLKLHPIRRQELGLKPRHLIVCLMSVYWKTYITLALMLLIKAVMEFAAPIGINRLLTYLQDEESTGDIRPWFWILWLFLGPVFSSLAWQQYIFLTYVMLVVSCTACTIV